MRVRSLYLGDPQVAMGDQGVAGVGVAILQQDTGRGRHPQLGQEQHLIVAVALGQLGRPVALPVTGTGETQRLAAGF